MKRKLKPSLLVLIGLVLFAAFVSPAPAISPEEYTHFHVSVDPDIYNHANAHADLYYYQIGHSQYMRVDWYWAKASIGGAGWYFQIGKEFTIIETNFTNPEHHINVAWHPFIVPIHGEGSRCSEDSLVPVYFAKYYLIAERVDYSSNEVWVELAASVNYFDPVAGSSWDMDFDWQSLSLPPWNRPPNPPSTPSGPTYGYVGISYTYTTSTTDPDGPYDFVRYQFDWGDSSTTTTEYWYPPLPTYPASVSHTWSSLGTHHVRVRAQDSNDAWSDWSPSLAVTISDPVCAMKTNTSGYFYIPNVATGLLKVEMLFDNQNITGDQTGETSPYSSINTYPDGKVNIRDVAFIASKFGLLEGESGWDYMADVCPDRKINIRDIATVAANSGKNGTYITDLSGVTVTFNTGEERTPDADGFVTIPPNATSFIVKRYGNPIGAMTTFW